MRDLYLFIFIVAALSFCCVSFQPFLFGQNILFPLVTNHNGKYCFPICILIPSPFTDSVKWSCGKEIITWLNSLPQLDWLDFFNLKNKKQNTVHIALKKLYQKTGNIPLLLLLLLCLLESCSTTMLIDDLYTNVIHNIAVDIKHS